MITHKTERMESKSTLFKSVLKQPAVLMPVFIVKKKILTIRTALHNMKDTCRTRQAGNSRHISPQIKQDE